MGNLLKNCYYQEETEIEHYISDNLDIKTKEELMMYIKTIRVKNINLSDKICLIELENTKLLPMAIELYEKLFLLLGERAPVKRNENDTQRRKFFIKPTFTRDDIMANLESTSNQISDIAFDDNLLEIDPFIIPMIYDEITLDEFNASFNKITSKKDMMGMTKLILKTISNYLKIRFINAFNNMLLHPENNTEICIARASYIYKVAKHGPKNEIKSFRPIMALPHIVNQFHRILNIRLTAYLQANKYLDTDIQKGGIAGQKHSIFEQYYKLKNVLKEANTNKKSCAILFLDISNAFGNVNLEKLYVILRMYGIADDFILYVKKFYENLEYYIDMKEMLGDIHKWNTGLVQGCSLSLLLFVIALNYILVHLDRKYKNDLGYKFNNGTSILLTAYVDDISVVCTDVKSAQIMYDEIERLLLTIGLPMEKSKSAIMILGDDTQMITPIEQVSVFKYLGEYLTVTGDSSENYAYFMKMLNIQLFRINKKYVDNEIRIQKFQEDVLPWIQRKTLIMYDLSLQNRLKIVSVVKSYTIQWGDLEYKLFTNTAEILNSSDDSVIKGIVESNPTEVLEWDIEITNYVYTNPNIYFEYSQIDENFAMELELDNLSEYTEQ